MTHRIAVYPGSFDPIHNGHLDIIERCLPLFDEMIVAVLGNDAKQPVFTLAERVEMIGHEVAGFANCRVESFEGLLVHFMKKAGAQTIIRGLRAVSDFEYEFQMALMNRRLSPEIETFFMTPKEEYSYLSSRLLKEAFFLGGDLAGLAPRRVLERLGRRAAEQQGE